MYASSLCIRKGEGMKSILIKDTTKQERIQLIRSWVPEDEVMDGCDIDLWEMYRDYIDGKRTFLEISQEYR